MSDTRPTSVNDLNIAVIGAGLMGHSIAGVFAAAGANVRITDPNEAALMAVPERVARQLQRLGHNPATADTITLHTDLADTIAGVHLVIEAATENLILKKQLFTDLDAALPVSTVLATNTSVYRITEIASATAHPERVVGTHWFNPPHLVPLVEVTQGERSGQQEIAWVIDLLQQAGKVPVHVRRDVAGFIGNRLQHALWREAISLVQDGVCDAETVDLVVRNSFGPRLAAMGPIENADYVGLDLVAAVHNYVFPSLNDDKHAARSLQDLLEAGHLGAKTGSGFTQWPPGRREEAAERLERHLLNQFHPQALTGHPAG